jgi:hypothetical protein
MLRTQHEGYLSHEVLCGKADAFFTTLPPLRHTGLARYLSIPVMGAKIRALSEVEKNGKMSI